MAEGKTTSDLMRHLENVMREHGDLPLVTWGEYGDHAVEDISKYVCVMEWTETLKGWQPEPRNGLCIYTER